MDAIKLNYLAIVAAVAANFIFGFLWYGPIFGKIWAKEMEFPADFKPEPKTFVFGAVMMTVGSFFIVWVLAHNMFVWQFFGMATMPQTPPTAMALGLSAAFFTWLGFFLPQNLGQKAWEGHSWKLVLINAVYNLIGLSISALILAHWK
jgi:hypothetical protein